MASQSIVLDIGSEYYKCGYGGEELPKVVGHSVTGTSKYQCIQNSTKHYCGEVAISKRSILSLESPIKFGSIVDADKFRMLFQSIIYNDLRISSLDQAVLLCENPLSSNKNRELLAQMLFEEYKFPKIGFCQSTVMGLYSIGELTGTSVDIGDQVTSISTIYEGYSLSNSRFHTGGKQITDNLKCMLMNSGIYFTSRSQIYIVQNIKEAISSCKETDSCKYSLPDSTVISIGKERNECTDTLFMPDKYGLDYAPIQCLISSAIKDCDTTIIQSLRQKIVVSGGTSEISGFPQKLEQETKAILGNEATVVATKNRKYHSWIGGSVISSLEDFKGWVKLEEYHECGCNINLLKSKQ